MDSLDIGQLLDDYAERFGEEAAERLAVPNYLGEPKLGPMLQAALASGKPITPEQATAAMGPAYIEEVL